MSVHPRPLDGVRVIELATYFFVPSAGAALADWGADVIKIEQPGTGDPMRALVNRGLKGADGVNYLFEQANRSTRNVAINVATPGGLELTLTLIDSADVFLTSLLPPVLERLGLDAATVQRRNPRVVYARGTGAGAHGPDRGKGGMDFGTFWGRGGLLSAVTRPGQVPMTPPPAFGDGLSGQILAGGIAAALLQRERTGHAPIVDVSLLSAAAWGMSADVVASKLHNFDDTPPLDPYAAQNPLVRVYETGDKRYLSMVLYATDRYWPQICAIMERPDLLGDPRFQDHESRMTNSRECIQELEAEFLRRPLDEWAERFASIDGVWEPIRRASELHNDPQVAANNYLRTVHIDDRGPVTLVASPVQFDEDPPDLSPAPEHGQHTEELLLELGIEWDGIIALKEAGAII